MLEHSLGYIKKGDGQIRVQHFFLFLFLFYWPGRPNGLEAEMMGFLYLKTRMRSRTGASE